MAKSTKKTKTVKKEPAKKFSPNSIDGVPGIGPTRKKALEEEGYTSALPIICKTPTWLKEITGMDREEAAEAFNFMKQRLIDAGKLNPQHTTATKLLKQRQKIQRVSTGCTSLDKLLNGGVECASVTEVYGENGSGKTQLSHSLAIMVQHPIIEGGLREENKPPPIVLYFDTEKTFRPERVISILAGKKLIVNFPETIKKKLIDQKVLTEDETKEYNKITEQQEEEAKTYLDMIEVQHASSAYHQFLLVQQLLKTIEHVNIKILIIDSGTALFRAEYLGRGNTKAKFDLLNDMLHDLKTIAENFKIPVVFINQIYNSPEETFGKDKDVPYGGNILGHTVPYRIKLEKSGRTKHKATIIKSPYQGNDEVKFLITEAGLSDVK